MGQAEAWELGHRAVKLGRGSKGRVGFGTSDQNFSCREVNAEIRLYVWSCYKDWGEPRESG